MVWAMIHGHLESPATVPYVDGKVRVRRMISSLTWEASPCLDGEVQARGMASTLRVWTWGLYCGDWRERGKQKKKQMADLNGG